MSKEIAQTVGTKRMAWLIALIAAFAVFATVGSQFRSASAVTEADVVTTVTAQTPDGNPAANVAAGTAVSYTITVAPATNPLLDGYVEINPDNDLTIASAPTFAIAPSAATGACTLVTGNTYLCHIGTLQLGSTATITVAGTANAAGGGAVISPFVSGDNNNTAAELEILVRSGIADSTPADNVVDGSGSTLGALTVIGLSTGAVVKSDHLTEANTAHNVAQTITLTNNSGADFDGSSVTISDAIATAGLTVTSVSGPVVTAGAFGTAPSLAAANCGAAGATTPFTIVCVVNFVAGEFDNGDAIRLTVNLALTANAGAQRSYTDTASVSTTALTFPATASGNGTITQLAVTPAGATPLTAVDLWHLTPYGGAPEAGRDKDNNLVGFLHKVCATNTAADSLWPDSSQTFYTGAPYGVNQQTSNPTGNIAGWNFRIDTISGAANINSPVIALGVDCDGDTTADDSTISWYSTQPGEQNITVVNDLGSVQIDSNTTPGVLGNPAVPLVKEWNTLLPTIITASAPAATAGPPAVTAANNALLATNIDGGTGSLAVSFNAANGTYYAATGVTVYENVLGTHTNSAGTWTYYVTGAKVTFLKTGTCGTLSILGGFITSGAPYAPSGSLTDISTTTPTIVYTDGSGPIAVTMSAPLSGSNCTFIAGQTIGFTAQAAYATDLGSQTPTVPIERYTVNLVAQLQVKQVFLAWAGQRIILEHDWRNGPGDVNETTANGICPFSIGQQIQYIKGTGPGNFLQGLGAVVSGNDQAIVTLADASSGLLNNQAGDKTAWPQGACISRVLYESEDPGEVDIEAFAVTTQSGSGSSSVNSTKVAFVVYYMKLNTVGVSLVTQVAKPTHNSSVDGAQDYAPGNPWDASKDAADNKADWNVSKDLLVRGRVTGWFTNSNPSGRAADTSDPLNVLPANRWVMPNDWALLAGGPADNADNSRATGTAEAFRPEYDIMVNPGRGNRGLDNPWGGGYFTSSTVLSAALDATGLTLTVGASLCATGIGNTLVRIDNEEILLPNITGTCNATKTAVTFVGVARGQNGTAPAAHAVGALVLYFTGSSIFEGPYSLIDIATFTGSGLGSSAALSSRTPGSIRDTIWKDGDVDWWDAPMPPALVTVDIRGTGFIKQVIKSDVYYNGPANSSAQTYPNPFYISAIPDSPYIPANVAGGGYFWNSWGSGAASGAYAFWTPMPSLHASVPGMNAFGITDTSVSSAQATELLAIRNAYDINALATGIQPDTTISRTLVVYSDNHGEFMVTANGDFKTDLTACASSPLGSATSKHCKPGDKVGTGSIYATADYNDFRGKHFPVKSNIAAVTWLWGGYKDVTVEAGETDQFKYVVFHGLDRDGFCSIAALTGYGVSLHPVLSGAANDTFNGNPAETVDFLIDSGEGIIIGSSSSAAVNVTKQFATGALTFSTYLNDPAVSGIKEFPLSSLAATGAVDECQTWIRVSNSLLGVLNVLVIAHDDFAEGDIGFDKIIDLTNTTSYTLNFRWSLVTWAGADNIAVADALKGTGTSGKNPGGNDISASVTAIYGWDQAAQQWLGYFPSGVNVPGANDLTALKDGSAYWIAITGPGSVTWTIASNVD